MGTLPGAGFTGGAGFVGAGLKVAGFIGVVPVAGGGKPPAGAPLFIAPGGSFVGVVAAVTGGAVGASFSRRLLGEGISIGALFAGAVGGAAVLPRLASAGGSPPAGGTTGEAPGVELLGGALPGAELFIVGMAGAAPGGVSGAAAGGVPGAASSSFFISGIDGGDGLLGGGITGAVGGMPVLLATSGSLLSGVPGSSIFFGSVPAGAVAAAGITGAAPDGAKGASGGTDESPPGAGGVPGAAEVADGLLAATFAPAGGVGSLLVGTGGGVTGAQAVPLLLGAGVWFFAKAGGAGGGKSLPGAGSTVRASADDSVGWPGLPQRS